jgi:hypothetical protein
MARKPSCAPAITIQGASDLPRASAREAGELPRSGQWRRNILVLRPLASIISRRITNPEKGASCTAQGKSVHEVSLQLPDLPAVALMAVLMRGVGQPRALQVVFAAALLVATAQGTCVPCATAPRAQSFRAPYPRFSAPPPPLSSSSLSPHSYWCDDAAASC